MGVVVNNPAIGIDFGTSNSTVGYSGQGSYSLVRFEGDNPNIPSAIFFDLDDGTVLFGRSAAQSHIDGHRGRFMRSMKSVLGSSLMEEKTRIGPQSVTFTSIIGLFIGHLKRVAETHLGHGIDRGVFGRPVFFVDGDEAADRAAAAALEASARRQGFKEIQFQYEPIAAALDYERTCTREELAIVVDVGGGTADFSVIRVSPNGVGRAFRTQDVLASHGVHIGGTDFDRALSLQSVMPQLGFRSQIAGVFDSRQLRHVPNHFFIELATWHKINQQYDARNIAAARSVARTALEPEKLEMLVKVLENQQGHEIANRVEKAKIDLTFAETTQAAIPIGAQTRNFAVRRDELDRAIGQMVTKLMSALGETIRLAGVSSHDIEAAFLTGGSTDIPLIRNSLVRLLPSAKVIEGDRFGSVGIGLAIDASRRFA